MKRRGYDKVIESGFSKVSEINRNNLLEYKEKKINKRVPLVLIYHPSLEKISGIVRHYWKEIEKSETLAKLFPEPPVVAFRRSKSIKDTLVRAAYVSLVPDMQSLYFFSNVILTSVFIGEKNRKTLHVRH